MSRKTQDARSRWPLLLLALLPVAAPAGCQTLPPAEEPGMTREQAALQTLTGRRVTLGNAVDCPEIETEDGRRHGLSYLSPAIQLGGRVTVTGRPGISTRCLGQVLIVETETAVD